MMDKITCILSELLGIKGCTNKFKICVFISPDGSEGDYDEETALFEQECDDFMKDFVTKIFLTE